MPADRAVGTGPTPDLIAGICAEFEKAWRAGDSRPLPDWLPADPAQAQAVLIELVRVELHLRLAAGQPARAEEYLARFPQLAAHPGWGNVCAGSQAPLLPPPEPTVVQGGQSAWQAGTGLLPLAGYEVLEELGRGGMGVVYKARQAGTQRLVALKMILSGQQAGPEETRRLRGEAEAVARLRHPNIVQIYEVGDCQGQLFLALELVEGGTLARRLAGNPQPGRESASLVETLARAMHHAHCQGIVHRDLKPANVLLFAVQAGAPDSASSVCLERLTCKITDFGLAKRLDQTSMHTQTGAVVGTPSYMAPEQASGKVKETGPATDVYALGAILYELLTGRPPFRGATILETLQQVVADEPVPPARLQPRLARDLETICLKCLAKEPARRYPSALALADDLRRFLTGEPILARPSGWLERTLKWTRRQPAQAGLIVLSLLLVLGLVAGGVGLFAYQAIRTEKDRAEKAEKEAREQKERAEKQEYYSWVQRALLAWKFEGATAAQQLLDQCRADLRGWEFDYVQRLCLSRKLTIAVSSGQFTCVCFSPDGQQLAGGRAVLQERPMGPPQGEVKLWDAQTGKEGHSFRSQSGPIRGISFSPDGKQILGVSGPRTVKVWDARTGKEDLCLEGHNAGVFRVCFSPDGKQIAGSGHGQPVKLWDARTGKEIRSPGRQPLEGHGSQLQPGWQPPGRCLL